MQDRRCMLSKRAKIHNAVSAQWVSLTFKPFFDILYCCFVVVVTAKHCLLAVLNKSLNRTGLLITVATLPGGASQHTDVRIFMYRRDQVRHIKIRGL